MDVDIGHLGAEEERALLVAGVDEFGDLCLQLLSIFDLLLEFLGLEEGVECWDNVAIYLRGIVLVGILWTGVMKLT